MANKVLKIDGYGKTLAGTIGFTPQEYYITETDQFTGAISFGTIDNLNAVLAFVNGIEVKIVYESTTNVINTIDILANTDSAGYPTLIDLYWNGSILGSGEASSSLGDLENNDFIRIYSIDI